MALRVQSDLSVLLCRLQVAKLVFLHARVLLEVDIKLFFSCVCLLASMARSVNCLGRKNAVQVHLIGAKPIVQVKR